ncbi:MAG: hypothetical protein IJM75_01240 [Ruminococcus sp.]|nr:hypothetical protein [Ruminococcus sp.]
MPRKKRVKPDWRPTGQAVLAFCTAALIVLALLLLAGAYYMLGQYKSIDRSEKVTAHLTGYAIKENNKYHPIRSGRETYDDDEVYAVLAVDTDGTFSKDTVYTDAFELVEGKESVDIFYDPDDPDNYAFDNELDDMLAGGVICTAFGAVCLGLGVWLIIFMIRRHKKFKSQSEMRI